ncbi:MAG: hypothetical protein JSV49_01840 [Thermoplasmata archaeon]|nr:MAG: hypothetical protein JSV49_01840 [Thermoplasmata archaeon]
MTLEQDVLDNMLGKTTIIAMVDGGRFRGTLESVGDEVIVLTNVLEMSEQCKWIRPSVSTALFDDVVAASESLTTMDEKAQLDKVMIYKQHILRIWPWQTEE